LLGYLSAGLLAFCVLFFILTLGFGISNSVDPGSHPGYAGGNSVQTTFNVFGTIGGIICAVAAIICACVGGLWKNRLIRSCWFLAALLVLWFLTAAWGTWAMLADRGQMAYAGWRTELALEIISSILWLFAILLAVAPDAKRIGEAVAKSTNLILLAVNMLFFFITFCILFGYTFTPADRFSVSVQAGFGMTACVIGLALSLLAAILLVTDIWSGLGDFTRLGWLFGIMVSYWFLGATLGIWIWGDDTGRNALSGVSAAAFVFELFDCIAVVALMVAFVYGMPSDQPPTPEYETIKA